VSDYLHPGLSVDQQTQTVAEQVMIVDD